MWHYFFIHLAKKIILFYESETILFFSVSATRSAPTSNGNVVFGTSNKRLETTLTKFSATALPFHLDVIQQRQANIERVNDVTVFDVVVVTVVAAVAVA